MTPPAAGPEQDPAVGPPGDPVLAQRARVARATRAGQRLGAACFGIAVAAFVVGVVTGFGATVTTVVTVALIAGSAVLAPAIVLGYAVRAADRADREDDWR